MAQTTTRGTFRIPEVGEGRPPTPVEDCDAAVADVRTRAESWASASPAEYVGLLERCIDATLAVAPDWVAAGTAAKRLRPGTPEASEEWIYSVLNSTRYLRLLKEAVEGIARTGRPPLPGRPRRGPGGRVVVPAVPADRHDRVLYPGFSAQVWLTPGVSEQQARERQASAYHGGARPGVSLVLGAGNVAAIPVMDALGRLFVDRRVVVLKMNPVNDYAGPFIEQALAPLVHRGVLRVVYGGADVGAHLVHHPDVDDVHITGSDKSFEAIVFGTGRDRARRKRERRPVLDKPVTGELGNLTPVVLVPGPWSERDIAYQARNVAAMITSNAGFNCIAMRVLVTHREWPQRGVFLAELRRVLQQTTPRFPYYPGARDRWQTFVSAHPEAERYGPDGEGCVPWTLIGDLDPTAEDEISFTTESFNGVFAEVAVSADSPAEFVAAAVRFCNERVWGSLGVSLMVHPKSQRDPAVGPAVERAVADLRYGTVAVNIWAGFNFAMGTTTWGAYPGHTLDDIQSGTGVVHNALMLADVEKTVLRARWRLPVAKAPWFADFRHAEGFWRRMAYLEGRRRVTELPGVVLELLRG